jgi:hypothetical protein
MKQLTQYIQEKLQITKDSKVKNYQDILKSHITNNPYEFQNANWIVPSGNFKPMRFSILIEYANEILKLNLLKDQEDINFCQNWLRKAREAYKKNRVNSLGWNSQQLEFISLCNGKDPNFGNAKFTYDLLQYGLSKSDTTIPRRKKLEKMVREFWYEVDKHKNEMNWYD